MDDYTPAHFIMTVLKIIRHSFVIISEQIRFTPFSCLLPLVVQCMEVLSSPTNGNLEITGNTYLSEAQYSCVEGFAVVGPTVRICQDDGQWSGNQPHCEGSVEH